ncbi:MAG: hypothetical protein AAF557_18760 [Pseudomonadota bacterium]
MVRCKTDMDTSGLDSALGDLVNAQLGLGKQLLNVAMAGSKILAETVGDMSLPAGKSCADIPEPCWMPKAAGEVTCNLCRGDHGELCLNVVNCDFRHRTFEVSAAGEDGNLVQIANKKFTLGPKERVVVPVRITVPFKGDDDNDDRERSCCDCDALDVLIWVKGCNNHYIRWVICIGERSGKCCHDITVEDTPDYELHWYDHFHYMRPCPGPIKT